MFFTNEIAIIKKAALMLGIFAFAGTANAGWEVRHASDDVTYVVSGKSKEESKGDGTWTIIDGKSGRVSMVHPGKKIYWQGSIGEFCTALKQMIPQPTKNPSRPKVTIEEAGGGTIAGLATKKYRVMADGQLHQEVWIAQVPELVEELNALEQQTGIGKCSSAQSIEEFVSRDPAYTRLLEKGYVMKEVTYMSGTPVSSDNVVSLMQRDIAGSEFDVPSGYRRVQSLMEIWM